ncbi:MAG: heparinase II/III family protein [Clostridia bacterium]|nr:heparinase II/III family protein [Clostridia bacterium]
MKMSNVNKIICLALVFNIVFIALPLSNIITLSASSEYNIMKDVLWDIDFEDETVDSSSSPVVAICDSSGKVLVNSRGDVFKCHTGSTTSELKIENGVLCFNPANTTDKVQTNEFYTSVSDGAAVFKMKVMVDDYNTSKYVFRLVYLDEKGSTFWAPQLYIKQHVGMSDSAFSVKSGTDSTYLSGTKTYECQKNTWYDVETIINIEDNTFSYKVNSTILASGSLGQRIASTQRVSIAPDTGESNAKASKLYVDDIYFYEATNEPYAKINVKIDGEEASRITKGNLSVQGEISNGYGAIDCVLALYRGKGLINLEWFEDVSDGTKWTQTEFVDFGYVDDSVEVKMIMLKSEDGITPVGKCVSLNKIGSSNQLIDTETLKTIFESDEAIEAFLKDKTAYHPDSGYITKDGIKIQSGYCGVKNNVLYVPAVVFENFGYDVSLQGSETAVISGYTFTSGRALVGGSSNPIINAPYVKDDKLHVPMEEVFEKFLGKYTQIINSGQNDGAIIISSSDFSLPTDETVLQKLSYYLLYERPDKEKILNDYISSVKRGVHPRVIMTEDDFEKIRTSDDSVINSKKSILMSYADSYLSSPELIYELRDGVRLWYVSMDFMDRVMALSFAYKMTGDERYLNKCIAEMDSIADFPTWHPEHHLDVGGLAVGFAIGYDWLYNDLPEEKITKYEASVYKQCFDLYYKGFIGLSSDMSGGIAASNNHNSVMNSGITLCAIAFMDLFPNECSYFISNSLRATEYTIHNFWPDGAWYEGIGYACMTLEYMALQLSATQNMFGTLYGIDASSGMDDAARFLTNMQSPTGAFGFYDGGGTGVQWHSGALWFAKHFGTSDVTAQWKSFYNIGEEARATMACLMYYNPDISNGNQHVETYWDVDFEDEYVGAHKWGYPYVQILSSDGRILSSNGDTLTAHSGTTSNKITTVSTNDAKYGKALSLEAVDTAEVQLNEFLTNASGDVIEFEYDYRLESLPTTGSNAAIHVMQPVVGDGTWLEMLSMGVSGTKPYFRFGGKQKGASVGTWYNIRARVDTLGKRLDYYIDDEWFCSSSFSASVTKGKKIVSKLSNAPGAVVWIDNFKVRTITHDSSNVYFGENDVYYSKNDVITLRDSRTSSTPVFVGAKGGFAADAHGHMDMGTFCFYSNGVKWLGIHGGADYNLPNFWSGGSRDSARWKYFTMRAEAHNCLVINPDDDGEYDPQGKAKFVRFENNDTGAIAVLDMTAPQSPRATMAKRGYFFTDNRHSLVVRDEINVSVNSDIYSFLITEHDVKIDGNKAIFTDAYGSGNTLVAEFECSHPFTLSAEPSKPLPSSPNPDSNPTQDYATRISLKTSGSGDVSVTMKLTPGGVNGSKISNYTNGIDSWSIN